MSEPADADSSATGRVPGSLAGEDEEIDALPVPLPNGVLVRPHPLHGALALDEPTGQAVIPAAQVPAVAEGGFVAGAAFIGLVHRHQRQRPAPARRRRFRRERGRGRRARREASVAGELVRIVGSRSLLLDVHLLGGSGAER